jgi:hypothetical protein
MKIKSRFLYLVIASLSFWGCEKEGPAGKNALVEQIAEPAGEHCASGGIKVITGIDDNRNNVLDSNEIQKTEYVCNGIYNKETIIPFPGAGYAYATDSAGNYVTAISSISDFNISNYPADSISFSTYMRTSNANVKCTVELYDLTNKKAISNSTLTTYSTAFWDLRKTTINFLNSFPKGTINLGVAIRSEQQGTAVSYYSPTIKIYKK